MLAVDAVDGWLECLGGREVAPFPEAEPEAGAATMPRWGYAGGDRPEAEPEAEAAHYYDAAGTTLRVAIALINPLVARGHNHHRHIVCLAAKDNALGDLSELDTQCICSLLSGARRAVQHDRQMGVTALLQKCSDALHSVRQCVQL